VPNPVLLSVRLGRPDIEAAVSLRQGARRHTGSMGSLLVQILPIAIAIAVEPVCIIAALIMPATNRPAANGLAYLGALVGVMLVYGAAVVLVLRPYATTAGARTGAIVETLWLLVGIGFLSAFAVILIRRPASGRVRREPRWMAWVERLGPIGACGVGLFLANWEMETPALAEILKARLPLASALGALLIFIAVAVSTSAVPLAVYLAAPVRVGDTFSRSKDWLSRHERPLLLVLFGLVGTVFTYRGAAALLHH